MPTYSSNFLEKVILRLDFEDVSLLKMPEYLTRVSDIFDVSSTQNGFENSFSVDVLDGAISQVKQELKVQELSSTQKPSKKIVVSQKWLTLEYGDRTYQSSSELLNDVDHCIQTFIDIMEVKLVNKVGLRYVNQIAPTSNAEPLAWTEYINSELVGNLSFALAKGHPISRSFAQQYYRVSDADMLFSYGIWNDDFPNPIVAKKFILDFYCSSNIPRQSSDIRLRSEIKGYNEIIESYFESSIEQPLRDLMGVQA